MKRANLRQDCAKPGAMSNVATGLRLLASFLFLICSVQATTATQGGSAGAKGEDWIAATEPAVQPTILVREALRHFGAEAFRFKPDAHAHPGRGDGNPVAIVSDLNPQFASGLRVIFYAWPDIRPHLPPVRAFHARAPPIHRA